jgi:hypothetical protein
MDHSPTLNGHPQVRGVSTHDHRHDLGVRDLSACEVEFLKCRWILIQIEIVLTQDAGLLTLIRHLDRCMCTLLPFMVT